MGFLNGSVTSEDIDLASQIDGHNSVVQIINTIKGLFDSNSLKNVYYPILQEYFSANQSHIKNQNVEDALSEAMTRIHIGEDPNEAIGIAFLPMQLVEGVLKMRGKFNLFFKKIKSGTLSILKGLKKKRTTEDMYDAKISSNAFGSMFSDSSLDLDEDDKSHEGKNLNKKSFLDSLLDKNSNNKPRGR